MKRLPPQLGGREMATMRSLLAFLLLGSALCLLTACGDEPRDDRHDKARAANMNAAHEAAPADKEAAALPAADAPK